MNCGRQWEKRSGLRTKLGEGSACALAGRGGLSWTRAMDDLPALPRDPAELQRKAWLGDAVLALVARRWILEEHGQLSARLFEDLTSNAFLGSVGNPTRIEALIGLLFERGGLAAADEYVRAKILPLYLQQQRNRRLH